MQVSDAYRSEGKLNRNALSVVGNWSFRLMERLFLAFYAVWTMGVYFSSTSSAQTFNQTSFSTLFNICFGPDAANITKSDNLNNNFCNNAPSGVISSPGSGAIQGAGSTAVEQRLQSVREAEEERRQASQSGASYAFHGTGLFADNGQLQLPPPGGAAPEIVVTPGTGFSLFFTAGGTALNHSSNRYEDGYEGALPMVTIGGDYWIDRNLLVGLAMNYTRFDATYDNGGDFYKNMFGPQLYATFLPFNNAFASLVLGYSRGDNNNTRHVVIPRQSPPDDTFTGHTSAEYSENLFSASLLTGYDYPIESFTIGPRLGLSYGYSQVSSFEEHGNTGAELRYSGLDRSSVQSSLGFLATVAFPASWGTVVPQLSAAWVHEYAGGARNVDAEYVDASPSPQFRFKREKVARNWATIGVALVAQMDNGMQPFVSFDTMQGNENFVTYGGNVGLRKSF